MGSATRYSQLLSGVKIWREHFSMRDILIDGKYSRGGGWTSLEEEDDVFDEVLICKFPILIIKRKGCKLVQYIPNDSCPAAL